MDRIMTEDEIERRAERLMDHLDRLLMSGEMTQKNYDHNVRELNALVETWWARLANEEEERAARERAAEAKHNGGLSAFGIRVLGFEEGDQ